jgi:uncharacterized membrane protein
VITIAKVVGFIGAVVVVAAWRALRNPIVVALLAIAVLCIGLR